MLDGDGAQGTTLGVALNSSSSCPGKGSGGCLQGGGIITGRRPGAGEPRKKRKNSTTTKSTYDTVTCMHFLSELGVVLYTEKEKAMAPHSSTLSWKIPWTEEPGGLQSMGSLRVGHD